MPKLKCTVENCAHNYDYECKKRAIDVEGECSRCKEDTECVSYIERTKDANDTEFAKMSENSRLETEVYCDVDNCVYEKNDKCTADRVEIVGCNRCNKKTNCHTFEPIQ